MAEHPVSSPYDPDWLDAKIKLALETPPDPEIPEGFAARVASNLPLTAPVIAPQRHGRRAAMVCVAVLLAMIFLLARSPAPTSPIWIAVESLFCMQFAIIAVWLAVRNLGSYFYWLA